jgi:glucans biosynthesis protein C
VVQATGKMPASPPPRPDIPGFFPLTHLWFLYVLLWLYAGTLAVRGLVAALDRTGAFRAFVDRIVKAVGESVFAPAILATPFLVALWFAPVWVKWFGIPSADMNLIVNPQALVAFGTSFGFGWLVHRQLELLRVWEHRWLLNLILAIGLSVACLIMVGPKPILAPAKRDAATIAFAICYALAIWTWTFALIGGAMRFLANESPVRRYIADSSYWIYLVHLPVVLALQVAVAKLGWPWFVKYPLILAVGFPIMFASYEWLVRYSFIGAILNGQRRTRPAKSVQAPALQESRS